MARLWILSDLHLEEGPFRHGRPDFDVLVNAGDTREGDVRACVEDTARLADGRPAILVLGNHDLYGVPLDRALEVAARLGARTGVDVLGLGPVHCEGIAFAGGTLWDDVRPTVRHPDGRRPDLTGILAGTEPAYFAPPARMPTSEPLYVEGPGGIRPATHEDVRRRRTGTLSMLASACADVVVTHHPPTDQDLAAAGWPSLWIHGHVHGHARTPRRGGETVLNAACSPSFDPGLVLDLGPGPSPGR